MITYYDVVQYVKDNHINWNTDLFEVLRDFFESKNHYSQPIQEPSHFSPQKHHEFKHPDNGEYTTEDLLRLFSI